jgi:hypothetical protein
MTKLDFKSAAIGFLSATTLVACVASSQPPTPDVGRYVPLSERYILDSATGITYRWSLQEQELVPSLRGGKR